MSQDEFIAARGAWGTVEWAFVSTDVIPQAYQFFLGLSDQDQAKVLALFQRLAESGRISSREKFKQLGERAGPKGRGLWEFKSFQIRFVGDFRRGCRFIVALGLRKKQDNLRMADIEAAIYILEDYDTKNGVIS